LKNELKSIKSSEFTSPACPATIVGFLPIGWLVFIFACFLAIHRQVRDKILMVDGLEYDPYKLIYFKNYPKLYSQSLTIIDNNFNWAI